MGQTSCSTFLLSAHKLEAHEHTQLNTWQEYSSSERAGYVLSKVECPRFTF